MMPVDSRRPFLFRIGRTLAALVVLTAAAAAVAAAEGGEPMAATPPIILDAVPRILVETRTIPASGEPTIRVYRPAETAPPLPAWRPPEFTLRVEALETAQVDRPFRIAVQAYDRNGEPAARFDEPVTFACELGVVPILATAPWVNGALVETVIVTRAGRGARLDVVAGDATASIHLNVAPPPLDRAAWLRTAEEHLAADRFADAVRAFGNASALAPGGDAEIENRLGRLYLQRGQWREAETHFRNAVRASMNAAPTP